MAQKCYRPLSALCAARPRHRYGRILRQAASYSLGKRATNSLTMSSQRSRAISISNPAASRFSCLSRRDRTPFVGPLPMIVPEPVHV